MAYSVRLMPRAAHDIEQIYSRIVQDAPIHDIHIAWGKLSLAARGNSKITRSKHVTLEMF